MNHRIAVIHTSSAVVETVDKQIRENIKDADICNIIDQKMLKDVIDYGGICTGITDRMCLYVRAAKAMGADVLVNACSSVGEAFETARQITDIPAIKIDEPMAEKVAESCRHVAVYGTVPTTLRPSGKLIEQMADKQGREITVTTYLVEGAFEVLAEEKNPEKHNRMVLDKIMNTCKNHDAIVLAQVSMTVLLPELHGLGLPVFYSLQSGIERVAHLLEGLKNHNDGL